MVAWLQPVQTIRTARSGALEAGRPSGRGVHTRRAPRVPPVTQGGLVHAVVLVNLGGVYLERKDHPTTAIAEVRMGGALTLQKRFLEAEAHSLAGYAVLVKASPDSTWLASARKDLVAIYEALVQPEKAARFGGSSWRPAAPPADARVILQA